MTAPMAGPTGPTAEPTTGPTSGPTTEPTSGPTGPTTASRRDSLVLTRPRPSARGTLTVLLVAAFLAALLGLGDTGGLVHQGGADAAVRIARSLLAPDLSPEFLGIVAGAALLTVSYAVAGMTVALVIGIPGAVLLSGVLVRRRTVRAASSVLARGVFGSLRAMHELVWALLFLTILGLTPVAGILAIGVPYGATLARVLGEHLQSVADEPIEALTTSGASRWQALSYGRIPMAASDMVAYLAYRFECAIRAAAVLSFIGLGGIGYRLSLALHDLRFDRVWPLIGALVLLIAVVDVGSARTRRALQA